MSSEVRVKDGMFLGALGAMTSFVVVLLLGAASFGIGFAPDAEERAAIAAERARNVGAGDDARIYATRCASCHGASGQGHIGPSFDRVSERFETPEEQEEVVRNGRNTMPAFGGVLSDEQIAAVVAYERTVLDGG
ncbi:MAG: c-type cytochrome [Acidimicrobiales bacterium]